MSLLSAADNVIKAKIWLALSLEPHKFSRPAR
jgi:hypothetical protein